MLTKKAAKSSLDLYSRSFQQIKVPNQQFFNKSPKTQKYINYENKYSSLFDDKDTTWVCRGYNISNEGSYFLQVLKQKYIWYNHHSWQHLLNAAYTPWREELLKK